MRRYEGINHVVEFEGRLAIIFSISRGARTAPGPAVPLNEFLLSEAAIEYYIIYLYVLWSIIFFLLELRFGYTYGMNTIQVRRGLSA